MSLADRFNVMLEHSRHHENDPHNHRFFGMRKNLLWYCRDFDGAAELRWHMKRVNCADDVERALESFIRDTTRTVPIVSNVPMVPVV
jgi:tRNA-dihydrouridine synthase